MADQNQPRPPYVRFERRAIEDRTKTLESGKYGFKDVDMAFITVPGNKDTVERFAEDWLNDLSKRAADGLCPGEWPDHFRNGYTRWKAGEAGPVNGTPIKGWGNLSPAEQKGVIAAGIVTVEDLAAANETALRALGMGSLAYKQKAEAFLKAAAGPGKLIEEIAAMKVANAALQEQVTALMARMPAAKATATL